MFADSPVDGAAARVVAPVAPARPSGDEAGLADNWDDGEGYYITRVGEVLDGRYEVTDTQGKGVFSSVVRARDRRAAADEPGEVAIKIIRNNETMHKAAVTEVTILRKVAGADPENRRHCIRLLRTFEHRDHTMMVFEAMQMNLREVIKKFGRNVGVNIAAVHAYAQQMLVALKHLKNCGVLHADIKPDNILANQRLNQIKLCDFGSAMFDGDNELTPYLVSRFYRAPEVVLGLPYSHPMDLWSIGCCLYELFTGKIAFPGRSNNEMLKHFVELKGPVPKKMVKKALFREKHFDDDGMLLVVEEDPVTKQPRSRLVRDTAPVKDLPTLLGARALAEPARRRVMHLADLLDKMFVLDPDKRITASEALSHPFLKTPP